MVMIMAVTLGALTAIVAAVLSPISCYRDIAVLVVGLVLFL